MFVYGKPYAILVYGKAYGKRGSVWRSHFALANSSNFTFQHSATSHTMIRRPVENFIRKYFH
jgi:hypothetical protein